MAVGNRPFSPSQVILGTVRGGMLAFISPNWSPMVLTCMSVWALRKYTPTVMTMMATSDPGIFLDTLGVRAMMMMLSSPTAAVVQSMVCRFCRYTAHLLRKSPGSLPSMLSPSRSFICVVKMVTAIPLVKPTTMG